EPGWREKVHAMVRRAESAIAHAEASGVRSPAPAGRAVNGASARGLALRGARRVRAVGKAGPDGTFVAVGVDPQPGRDRGVVEAVVGGGGPGSGGGRPGRRVRLADGVRVTDPGGEALGREAIVVGARVWLRGHYTPVAGLVADEVRLKPRREFEIEKVSGPATMDDAAGTRLEIAGFP